MKFTELKLKKVDSTPLADIYSGLSNNFYEVKLLPLSEKEKAFAEFLSKEIRKGGFLRKEFDGAGEDFNESFVDEIVSVVQVNSLVEKLPSRKLFVSLVESMIKLVSKVKFVQNKALFSEYVLHNAIGLKQLAFFSLDDDLEELMVNGAEGIFVFHKKYGMCKTNLVIEQKELIDVIQRVALTVGREFNSRNALLDARLPDGSRVNATLSDVSPTGATLTIRKFSAIPLTILDLILNNTITAEAAAFLWFMVDGYGIYPQNILVSGGTASGKTTFLNVLSNFMRLSERVISIEDTIELSLLGRENWVALESRTSEGMQVTMDSLLRNAMRMRPDRIIVGEVRGPEALTLFTAMDTGHQGCLGTVHANNARETLVKLQERPLSVPQSMLPLLDFIIIMQRRYSAQKGMQRRIVQIVELSRMEDKVLSAVLFDFDEKNDLLKRTELQSQILEEIAHHTSLEKNDLKREIEVRQKILEWMLREDIRKPLEVLEVIESYYYNPEKVLSTISNLS
ncbi:MAG: ATPase, T2SS/T4P/T4SS family [archaeon]|jgi:flagellar protein FlaI